MLSTTGCNGFGHTAAEQAAHAYARQEIDAAPPHGNLPDYSLPPQKLAQARQLSTTFAALHFTAVAWGILQLVLLLALGAVARMRDRAVAVSRNRWLQAAIFVFLLLFTRLLLNLPLNLFGHHLSLRYGFSIQRWPSWFADLAKGFAINWVVITLLAMLLFWIMGLAPRRWWLVFWAAAVPIVLASVYLAPILIDPLFNKFEPLALHHPELTAQLEHMGVPADRQFLMRASAKVTTPNAYVTGLVGSKRVVVWDTSLTGDHVTPGVLWMVGHECGHYALNHVLTGTLLSLAALPLVLWLAFLFLHASLRRFGSRWRIPSQHDWGALAVLLLAYSLINLVQEPIANDISRHVEHNADIYGEEAIHGLVPDPQTAVRDELDADGLRSLDDPNPSPLAVLWMYNHPPTGYRAAFGKAYDPWAPGFAPKYFKGRE
jgi:STE24 endopeptidase